MARRITKKQKQDKEAQKERIRRKRMFQKRSKNLIKKLKELPLLTPCRVAIVIEGYGNCDSVRASDNPSWPPGIDKTIEKYPCGKHEYFQTQSSPSNPDGFRKTLNNIHLGDEISDLPESEVQVTQEMSELASTIEPKPDNAGPRLKALTPPDTIVQYESFPTPDTFGSLMVERPSVTEEELPPPNLQIDVSVPASSGKELGPIESGNPRPLDVEEMRGYSSPCSPPPIQEPGNTIQNIPYQSPVVKDIVVAAGSSLPRAAPLSSVQTVVDASDASPDGDGCGESFLFPTTWDLRRLYVEFSAIFQRSG